jgi:hypothetical protein
MIHLEGCDRGGRIAQERGSSPFLVLLILACLGVGLLAFIRVSPCRLCEGVGKVFSELKYGVLKMTPMTKSSYDLARVRRAFPMKIDTASCAKCDGRGKVSVFIGWLGSAGSGSLSFTLQLAVHTLTARRSAPTKRVGASSLRPRNGMTPLQVSTHGPERPESSSKT